MTRFELLILDPDNDHEEIVVKVTADTPERAIEKGERLWPDCPILAWRDLPEPKLIVGRIDAS